MELSPGRMVEYFKKNNCKFENGFGVKMEMSKEEMFYSLCKLPKLPGMDAVLKVICDEDTVYSFIEGFRLKGTLDVERISYNYLWMRYRNGGGGVVRL